MTIDNLDALLRGEDYVSSSSAIKSMPTMKTAFDTLVSAAVRSVGRAIPCLKKTNPTRQPKQTQ